MRTCYYVTCCVFSNVIWYKYPNETKTQSSIFWNRSTLEELCSIEITGAPMFQIGQRHPNLCKVTCLLSSVCVLDRRFCSRFRVRKEICSELRIEVDLSEKKQGGQPINSLVTGTTTATATTTTRATATA
eukprot:Pompholyxophrys_punicea_v1_NODE_865_length_1195_cov_3.586842.p1 type:complete len:130 gc:universal NODE_865_length_1195_cov_3.586842:676-1065(+)